MINLLFETAKPERKHLLSVKGTAVFRTLHYV
jgi:hypothetical protein